MSSSNKLICAIQAIISAEEETGRKHVKNKLVIFSIHKYDPSKSFVEINWRTQDEEGPTFWEWYWNDGKVGE